MALLSACKDYWAAAAPCWSWTTELFRCPPPLHHSSAQNRLWKGVQKQQQLICAFRGFIIQSSQHFAKLFSVSIIQTGKKEIKKEDPGVLEDRCLFSLALLGRGWFHGKKASILAECGWQGSGCGGSVNKQLLFSKVRQDPGSGIPGSFDHASSEAKCFHQLLQRCRLWCKEGGGM